jgi:excisionase family DNA binding protein
MKGSGRGRSSRERVEAARRQAAVALGRDPDQRDSFIETPSSSPPPPATTLASKSSPVESRGIGVLSIGEAAVRLGMSRSQVDAMIDRGALAALPTGFTRMIPTIEVMRLQQARTDGT